MCRFEKRKKLIQRKTIYQAWSNAFFRLLGGMLKTTGVSKKSLHHLNSVYFVIKCPCFRFKQIFHNFTLILMRKIRHIYLFCKYGSQHNLVKIPIINVRYATGHSSCKISSSGSQDNDRTPCHILTSMVPTPLKNIKIQDVKEHMANFTHCLFRKI